MEVSYLHRDNPDYPISLNKSLGAESPVKIAIRGNPDILKNRSLAFFCSVKCPGRLILKTYDLIQALLLMNVTIISGFHSPVEQECLRILLRGKNPIIICLARSIEKMRIKKPLTAGQILLISPFIDKPQRPDIKTTLYRNRFVAGLADQVFVAYAEPNGKTESLCREIVSWQKPLYTLESHINMNIISIGANPVIHDNMFDKIR